MRKQNAATQAGGYESPRVEADIGNVQNEGLCKRNTLATEKKSDNDKTF